MAFVEIGKVLMDLDKLLYVEPGAWDSTKRDNKAVFVMLGGHKYESPLGMSEVQAKLLSPRGLDVTAPA